MQKASRTATLSILASLKNPDEFNEGSVAKSLSRVGKAGRHHVKK